MKTNNLFKLIAVAILTLTMSCNSVHYTMRTKLNKNGSLNREVYAKGDSSFLSGNVSHNPYMFNLDSLWKIKSYINNESEDGLNVKISRYFNSFNDVYENLKPKQNMDLLVLPQETFTKKFKWFYTYYSFKAVYKSFADNIPIPIDNYLSTEEQKLWFQADLSAYKGLNGLELKSTMDDIEDPFLTWIAQNMYEINYSTLEDYLKSETSVFYSRFSNAKDSLFSVNTKFIKENDLDPSAFCNMLDSYFKTDYFSVLYKNNKPAIENIYKQKSVNLDKINALLVNQIRYELVMPGRVITSNSINTQNTLVWNVDAFRIIANDYVLQAESRTTNIWTFNITVLLIGLAVYCLFKTCKRYVWKELSRPK